jgi:small subunit ribosomal protein S1
MKQMVENPLRKAEGKFKVGSDHDGKVKSSDRSGVVVDFGEDGEGFIPRRELSHDRVERVEDSFKPGMALEGMRVIEFDRRSGRPTLSLVAAEREEQHKTLKNYKASSKATSFTIGDLSELKAKLEKIEREG